MKPYKETFPCIRSSLAYRSRRTKYASRSTLTFTVILRRSYWTMASHRLFLLLAAAAALSSAPSASAASCGEVQAGVIRCIGDVGREAARALREVKFDAFRKQVRKKERTKKA